jgi:molybdopterin converting factor small subunit
MKMPGMIFSKYAGNRGVIEVNGSTVGECLENLVTQFPEIKQQLYQQSDKLQLREVHIFINGEILYPEDLDRMVMDDDEIFLLHPFFGG